MSNRNPQRRPATQCLFCELAATSGEHLWPDWMAPYFPKTSHDKSHETWRRAGSAPTEIGGERIFHRHATKRKLRYVCHACNNGWMGRIETAAKPFLLPMMLGRTTSLTAGAQRAVAEWLTLKMMVYEQTDTDIPEDGSDATVFSREDALAFSADRTMPPHLNIWLLKNGGGRFNSHLTRVFARLIRSDDRPDTMPKKANAQTVLFGAGRLLAYFAHSSRGDLNEIEQIRQIFAQAIWPVRRNVTTWPPLKTVSDAQAANLAWALERYVIQLKAEGA